MSRRFTPPSECPICGADVPPRAHSCPGCGADERTGWNEDATRYDGLDLPDSAFEETPSKRPATHPRFSAFFTSLVGGLLLLALLWLTLRSLMP